MPSVGLGGGARTWVRLLESPECTHCSLKAVDKELVVFVGHSPGQGEEYSAGGKCFVGTSQAGVQVFCQAQYRPV